MKRILLFSMLLIEGISAGAQEQIYTCDQYGIRLIPRQYTIRPRSKSKSDLEQKIRAFIKTHRYAYRPYYSGENRFAYRIFSRICEQAVCGSDLYASVLIELAYTDSVVLLSSNQELFSSIHGGKLVINENDDVASINNVPFGNFEFEITEKYEREYPESIYTYDKRNRVSLRNQTTKKVLQNTFDQYVRELKQYLEQ